MWECEFIGLRTTGPSMYDTDPLLVGGLTSLVLYW